MSRFSLPVPHTPTHARTHTLGKYYCWLLRLLANTAQQTICTAQKHGRAQAKENFNLDDRERWALEQCVLSGVPRARTHSFFLLGCCLFSYCSGVCALCVCLLAWLFALAYCLGVSAKCVFACVVPAAPHAAT